MKYGFQHPLFQLSRSASTEKEKGERELKKNTHTFSDWMVLQKVLVAMEVEQAEFMFWFYFSESSEGGIQSKKNLLKLNFFFFFPPQQHMQFHIQLCPQYIKATEVHFINIPANFQMDCLD